MTRSTSGVVLLALLLAPALARAQTPTQPPPDSIPPLPPPLPPAPPPAPAPVPGEYVYQGPVAAPPVAQPPPARRVDAEPAPRRARERDPDEINEHSIKLEGGGAFRKLHAFDFFGMDFRGGFGAENEHLGHYGTVGFVWGETGEHLRTYSVMAGYNLDVRVDIVRIGFGIEAGYLWVRRASVDARMYALGAGGFGHVSVDVVNLGRRGHNALYVDGRLTGSIHYGNAAFWGPSLLVGVRF